MQITKDKKEQPMIEWQMAPGGWKRAWIQDRTGNPEKDWANTGRYLNVVRIEGPNIGTGGNATDAPIFGCVSFPSCFLFSFGRPVNNFLKFSCLGVGSTAGKTPTKATKIKIN